MASIVETTEDGVVVLAPEGSLGAASACAALETRLKALVQKGAHRLVVDLHRTSTVGGGAIRVLLLIHRKLSVAGGCLVLASPNDKVRRAFEVSGFDRDFTLLPSRSEAVRQARNTAAGTTEPALEPAVEPAVSAIEPNGEATANAVLALLGGGTNRSGDRASPATALSDVGQQILRILAGTGARHP